MRANESCFHLVLLAQPFTHSPPARIDSMVDTKKSIKTFFFETAIGDFSCGYFMKRLFNDCSYVCGLNSKLFLHTDKNIVFYC